MPFGKEERDQKKESVQTEESTGRTERLDRNVKNVGVIFVFELLSYNEKK